MHPQPRVRNKKARRVSHHRFPGTVRHSPRNGFNSLCRTLLGDRAFLPPSFARIEKPRSTRLGRNAPPQKLDASVGASGPHDFAVRNNIVRLRALCPLTNPCGPALRSLARPTLSRPPHPPPNVRDDRETPLLEGAGRGERCW